MGWEWGSIAEWEMGGGYLLPERNRDFCCLGAAWVRKGTGDRWLSFLESVSIT